MAVTYLSLTPLQKSRLFQYIDPFISANSGILDHRARLEEIDKLIERSYDSQAKTRNCKDEKSREPQEDNVTVPVVGPQLSTISAQLAKIFLKSDPPIQMFAAPAGSSIANQYNIIYGKYSRTFQWRRNLLLCLQSAVNYNFCAAEIRWKARAVKALKSVTNLQTGGMRTVSAFEEGEVIKHLHPYNVLWDGSVPLNEVSQRGAYAGYIQQVTKIALYQLLRDEGIELTPEEKKNIKKEENAGYIKYYVPEINPVTQNDTAPKSYDAMWEGKDEKETFTSTELFNLYTLYVRLIPSDFNIPADSPDDINVIKILLLGDRTILAAQLLDNAHQLLPIAFGQIHESSLGLNSFTVAEELEPIQNTATKLYRTEIASARRMLADRAIYDSNIISEKDINDPSPTAKIKMRRSMSQAVPITSAYYSIPYEDRAMGVRISQANALLGFASPISGTNQAMEGQFIRGNKSAQEFNSIMASAGDRILQSAVFFDDQFMSPLRTILLSDTLQYQNDIKLFDKDSGQFVEVKMDQLREQPLDFEIAAGLLPASEMASLDFLQVLLQTFMSRPDLDRRFKSIDALCYIAETRGVKYLTRFLRSEAEIQQMQQQALAMQQQQLEQKAGVETGQRAAEAEIEARLAARQNQQVSQGQ